MPAFVDMDKGKKIVAITGANYGAIYAKLLIAKLQQLANQIERI